MAPLSALDLVNDPDFEKFDLSSVEYIGVGGSPLTESIKNKVKVSQVITHAFLFKGTFIAVFCTQALSTV